MALAVSVKLAKGTTARFPARCVVCGALAPSSTLKVATHAIGWWTALTAFGDRFTVAAPACASCGTRETWKRRLRFVVTMIFVAIGVYVATRVLPDTRGLVHRYGAIGIALVVMLPWILWTTFFPPLFDVTAFSDTVDYEFKDRRYAEDFAVLNQTVIAEHPPD